MGEKHGLRLPRIHHGHHALEHIQKQTAEQSVVLEHQGHRGPVRDDMPISREMARGTPDLGRRQ